MKPALFPPNEDSRLQELYSYGILDTGIDEDFEAVLDLLLAATGAGMATISLVDADRQWVKAGRNVEAGEWPRDASFAASGILSDELFIVEDALHDRRFEKSPFVTGPPYVRFYAGAPLITERGYRIGMLAIMDSKPRTIDDYGKESLFILSGMTVNLLELRRQRRRNSQLRQALEHRERNTLQTLSSLLNIYAENSGSTGLENFNWIKSVRDRLNATSCMLGHVNESLGATALSSAYQLPIILRDMLLSTESYTDVHEVLDFECDQCRVAFAVADPLLLLLYEALTLAVDAGVRGRLGVRCRGAGGSVLPAISFAGDEQIAERITGDLRFALLETLAARLSASVVMRSDAGTVTIICAPVPIAR